MKTIGFALFLALISATPAFAGAQIDAAGQTVTHDCGSDAEITINGSGNEVTVTGTCDMVNVQGSSNQVTVEASKKVSVTGSGNQAAIEAADRISISGTGNSVTWKKGLKAKKPKVSRSGVNNSVKQVK